MLLRHLLCASVAVAALATYGCGDDPPTELGTDAGEELLLKLKAEEFSAEVEERMRHNTPLIVVDGEIATDQQLRDLRIEDVASIQVHRGENAIERHGPEASNGVVNIRLKKE